MSDEPTIESWDPTLRAEIGHALADRLRADVERAHAIGIELAPEGTGAGVRFTRYEVHLAHGRAVAYRTAFPSLEPFLVLLDAGDPGAIELGFEIASRIDPEPLVPLAARLLPAGPWKGLGRTLGRTLGLVATEASFELLIEHGRVPYLRDGLYRHGWPGGVERAWEVVRAAGDLHGAIDPWLRVQTEPVIAYLAHHDPARSLPFLAGLRRGLPMFAARRLRAIGTEASLAVLFDALASTPATDRLDAFAREALVMLFERDPTTIVDRLGGLPFLASPDGRMRAREVAEELGRDTWRKPEPSRGWLRADPRFAEILAVLRSDPDREVAGRARDLLATLPQAPKPAKKPATKKAVKGPLDAALVAEMERVRTELERLVTHLRKIGYRFVRPRSVLTRPSAADRRAITKAEKALGALPPVLEAFFTIVGSVDLRGQDPRWSRPASLELPGVVEGAGVWQTDPLAIAPASVVLRDALEEASEPPFRLAIAPDATGKAGYSGGALVIWLPSEGVDPRIEGGDRTETLREHLARALDGGGMLGWDAIAEPPAAWIAAARTAARG
jgi:hypothetical protein